MVVGRIIAYSHLSPLINVNLLFLVVLSFHSAVLILGFKLIAASITACAFIGVSIGVGFIFGSLVYSISRNPALIVELTRYSFIGFSLVESAGLIGLIMSFVLLFGF